MMPTFDPSDIVAHDGNYTIYRKAPLLGLCLVGLVDNDVSNTWREALEKEIIRADFPDYFAIDGSRMDAKNSPASRLRTAVFVRGIMRRAKFAVLRASDTTGSRVVMQALLGMAGVKASLVVTSEEAFISALEALHAGRLPV
jgi:hypothetical protein